MKSVFLILVLSLALLPLDILCLESDAYYEEIFQENHFKVNVSKAELSCTCKGHTKTGNFEMDEMDEVFVSIFRHEFCQKNKDCNESGWYQGCGQQVEEVCDLFNQCHNCFVTMERCEINSVKDGSNYKCHKQKISVKAFRAKFDYERNKLNDSSGHLSRRPRKVATCLIPKVLQTSEIDCVFHTSLSKCTQKCQFGYTLKDGIQRQMSCLHSEDEWKPTGFEECEAFIDCNLKLIGPGKLKCNASTVIDPPTCEVECFSNGETKGTPNESYTCRISGQWSKKLPPCVTSKSVLNLVPAPRIKLHSKHDFVPREASEKQIKKIDM